MNKKNYIALFDLDHTILNDSSGKIIGIQAFRYGLLQRTKIAEGVLLSLLYKLGVMDGDRILSRMAEWLKDSPVKPFVDFVNQIGNDLIRNSIRPQAIREIEYHKKNNGATVILSASIRHICTPLVEVLGLDDIICSDLDIVDERFSGRPIGQFCYGQEKLNRTLAFCENNGYALEDAYFYTDHISDLPMLEAVGNPRVVTPDRRLAATALARGWKIHDWQN